jgi:integrase/recombinase XerD
MTEYISRFIAYLRFERGLSGNTIASYQLDLRRFAASVKVPAREITRRDVRTFLANELQAGRNPRSVARCLSAVRQFFRFLLDEEEITKDPTIALPIPKTWKTVPHSITAEEVQKIADQLDASPLGLRDRAMLLTCFGSGLRVSELVSLQLDSLDFEHSALNVRQGKGAKDRIAPLNPVAIQVLKNYIEIGRPALLCGESSPFLFVASADSANFKGRHRPLTRVLVFLRFRDLAEKALGKKISPHWLRHSFATTLVNGGADIRAVQAMLGHAGIDTTQIYLNIDLRQLRAAYYASHPSARRKHAEAR